jgi:ferredoxin
MSELHVDPIACDGHGLCAELFPEHISLDDWGYPIVARTPIPRPLVPHARRAVAECPKSALRLAGPSRTRERRHPVSS